MKPQPSPFGKSEERADKIKFTKRAGLLAEFTPPFCKTKEEGSILTLSKRAGFNSTVQRRSAQEVDLRKIRNFCKSRSH